MSSCMCKVMERIINERLVWIAESRGWIDKTQNGFRRGRSCLDNLTRITADVEINLNEGGKVLAAFLDVKSAYDNVIGSVLVDQLIRKGCPANIVRFVQNWIRDRTIKFIIGEGKDYTCVVNKGLPQGVISPTLYGIYTTDITERIKGEVKILQYADDIAIYIIGKKTKREAVNLIKNNIDTIDKNLNRIALEVEPSKTNLIWFDRDIYGEKQLKCNIKGEEIKSKEQVKFLGITFDRELNFEEHVKGVKERMGRVLNVFKFVNRVSWGMELNTAMLVYKIYIRSVLENGLFVYYPRGWKGRDALEKLQNRGLRIAMGYRNSTPINVMTAVAKIIKIEDRAGELARNFWTRIISNNRKDLISLMNKLNIVEARNRFRHWKGYVNLFIESWRGVNRFKNDIEPKLGYGIYNSNYRVLTDNISVDIEIGKVRQQCEMEDGELIRKFEEKYQLRKDCEVIYTDGSFKTGNRSTGIGICRENDETACNISINPKF